MYKYFCGDCGHRFHSDTPERDQYGALNEIYCPRCGVLEVYRDTPEGHRESVETLIEYENRTGDYI